LLLIDVSLPVQLQEAKKAAVAYFQEHAMGDAVLLSDYEGRLRADMEVRYETALRNLAIVGEKAAVEMLAKGEMQLHRLMATPGVTLDMVEADLKRCDGNSSEGGQQDGDSPY
jgi:hypothetical protein